MTTLFSSRPPSPQEAGTNPEGGVVGESHLTHARIISPGSLLDSARESTRSTLPLKLLSDLFAAPPSASIEGSLRNGSLVAPAFPNPSGWSPSKSAELQIAEILFAKQNAASPPMPATTIQT